MSGREVGDVLGVVFALELAEAADEAAVCVAVDDHDRVFRQPDGLDVWVMCPVESVPALGARVRLVLVVDEPEEPRAKRARKAPRA